MLNRIARIKTLSVMTLKLISNHMFPKIFFEFDSIFEALKFFDWLDFFLEHLPMAERIE